MKLTRHPFKVANQRLLPLLAICLFSLLSFTSFANEYFTCNAVVTTTGNSMTISGVTSPNVILKVYNPDWSLAYECNGNCTDPTVINDLSEGTYRLSLRLYDSNWSKTCEQNQDITIDGSITPPSSDCDVTWTTTSTSVTVRGLNAPHNIFKLFNSNWSIHTQCFDNCPDPFTIDGLTAGATYYISYNLYDEDWEEFCDESEEIVLGGSGEEADLDLADLRIPTQGGDQGTVVEYTFDLKNIGQIPAFGNYVIGAYLSTNNSLGNSDVRVGEVNTGNTPVGTIQDVLGSITIPSNLATGDYYLILDADIENNIAESNESNNKVARPFEVTSGITGGEACGFFKENEATYSAGPNISIQGASENNSNYVINYTSSIFADDARTVSWTIDKEGNSQGVEESPLIDNSETPNEFETELLDNQDLRITYTDGETGAEIWSATTELSPGSNFDIVDILNVGGGLEVYDGFLFVGTLVAQAGNNEERFFQFTIKFDESGNIERKRILGEDVFDFESNFFLLGDESYTTEDGYVIFLQSSSQFYFVKFGNSGRFEWLTIFASDLPSNLFLEAKTDDSEDFIYALNRNNLQIIVDKIRISDGTKIYKANLGDVFGASSSGQESEKILLTEDGGIVVGYTYRFASSNDPFPQGFVYGKLDADGNEVWSNTIEQQEPLNIFTPILETADGGYLFAANDSDNRQLSAFKVTAEGALTPTCDGEVTVVPNGSLPCDLSYSIDGDNLTITGSGLSAPHIILKVYGPDWRLLSSCNDNCGSSISLSDLAAGPHRIDIQLFDDSWQKTCSSLEEIQINTASSAIIVENSLLYFKATRNGTEANLNWVVNNSDQTNYFVLERSATGDEFTVIGEMNELNGGNSALTYQSNDASPVTGNNFYRIMQVFRDGAIRYSNIQHLSFEGETGMLIFPNPATNDFSLSLNMTIEQPATVVIYNQLGQAVQQRNLVETPTAPLRFNTNELENGIYHVVLHLQNGKVFSQKLVVTKL